MSNRGAVDLIITDSEPIDELAAGGDVVIKSS
jgi:hypothetical protein